MKPTLARAKKIAAKHNCPRCGKPSNPVTNFGKVRATATLLDLVCRYCGNRWSAEYGSTKPTTAQVRG